MEEWINLLLDDPITLIVAGGALVVMGLLLLILLVRARRAPNPNPNVDDDDAVFSRMVSEKNSVKTPALSPKQTPVLPKDESAPAKTSEILIPPSPATPPAPTQDNPSPAPESHETISRPSLSPSHGPTPSPTTIEPLTNEPMAEIPLENAPSPHNNEPADLKIESENKQSPTKFTRNLIEQTRVPLSGDILLGVIKGNKKNAHPSLTKITQETPPEIKKSQLGDLLKRLHTTLMGKPSNEEQTTPPEEVLLALTSAQLTERIVPNDLSHKIDLATNTALTANAEVKSLSPQIGKSVMPPVSWVPLPTALKPDETAHDNTVAPIAESPLSVNETPQSSLYPWLKNKVPEHTPANTPLEANNPPPHRKETTIKAMVALINGDDGGADNGNEGRAVSKQLNSLTNDKTESMMNPQSSAPHHDAGLGDKSTPTVDFELRNNALLALLAEPKAQFITQITPNDFSAPQDDFHQALSEAPTSPTPPTPLTTPINAPSKQLSDTYFMQQPVDSASAINDLPQADIPANEEVDQPKLESLIKTSADIFNSVAPIPTNKTLQHQRWYFKINENLTMVATKTTENESPDASSPATINPASTASINSAKNPPANEEASEAPADFNSQEHKHEYPITEEDSPSFLTKALSKLPFFKRKTFLVPTAPAEESAFLDSSPTPTNAYAPSAPPWPSPPVGTPLIPMAAEATARPPQPGYPDNRDVPTQIAPVMHEALEPAHALTVLKPVGSQERQVDFMPTQIAPQMNDEAVGFPSWQELENEVGHLLSRIVGQQGAALPMPQEGLVGAVKHMVSAEQSHNVVQALKAQNFERARLALNDVVEEQTRQFLEWRRQFGQFSRLFGIVTMSEDPRTAFKALQKATELDPTCAWNWYACAMAAGRLEDQHDAILPLLDNALSVAVSGNPHTPRHTALQSLPHLTSAEVYALILTELSAQLKARHRPADASAPLNGLLEYFNVHAPTNDTLRDHHLSAAHSLVDLEKLQGHWPRAAQILQALLALPYCQGLPRLHTLLGLILLRHHVALPLELLEPWFGEATTLLLSFPQHHEHGAQYYRTLALYHAEGDRMAQAQELLNTALTLDRQFNRPADLAEDLHHLAKWEWAQGQERQALLHWQEAHQLIAQSQDLKGFNRAVVAETWLALANVLFHEGEGERAKPFLEKGMALLIKEPPSMVYAQNLLHLGTRLLAKNLPIPAEHAINGSLLIGKALGASSHLRQAYLAYAQCELTRERYAEAEKSLQSARALLEHASPIEVARLWVFQGLIHEAQHAPQSAVNAAQEALRALSMLPSDQPPTHDIKAEYAAVHSLLGRAFTQMGQSAAVSHIQQAMRYTASTPMNATWVELEKTLAQALLQQKQTTAALELLETTLVHAATINDRTLQWELSVLLANTLTSLQAFDRAEGLLRQVHEQARTANNPGILATNSEAFADYYAQRGQTDTALSFYEQTMNQYRKLGKNHALAQLQFKMAQLLLSTQRTTEAQAMLQLSAQQFEQMGATRQSAETLTLLAKIVVKSTAPNSAEEAEQLYQKAVELWRKADSPERLATELASLGILKMRRGKMSAAKADWQNARAMFESLGNATSVAQVNTWLDMLG